MKKDFETMVCFNDLAELGFKPHQAKQMIKESKEYLAEVEGVDFYFNRQVCIVPARIIEKLFNIQTSHNEL